MTMMALSDLKVLELGEFVSAPWCGRVLASMGAEVIKVEPPGRGDKARRAGPFPGDVPHPEKSGLFLYLNTDKLGVTLDVTHPSGRRLFLELVRQVDVVVDNHLPRELRAWSLDYEQLREVNPRVVFTSITPFGWNGPWSEYSGNDLVAFHTGGPGYETPVSYVTDPDNEPPLKGAEYQADMTTGWTALAATMIAVRHQWRFGEGQLLDVSAQEALANMVRPKSALWSYSGDVRDRLKQGATVAMACKDGYVALSAGNDSHWQGLVRMLDEPAWTRDERFATREGRTEHREELGKHIAEAVKGFGKEEIFQRAQSYHIPCFPYNSVPELLESPQYQDRGFWVQVEHPLAGTYTYPGSPYHFSRTPATLRHPAPLLGQDNEEVFCQRLGHSREELRDLFLAGVV